MKTTGCEHFVVVVFVAEQVKLQEIYEGGTAFKSRGPF